MSVLVCCIAFTSDILCSPMSVLALKVPASPGGVQPLLCWHSRYPRVLAVYNQPQYDRMFLRDAATGRKIFVFPSFPGFDPAFVADIQLNGGRNDVVAVRTACLRLHVFQPL